jgi:hypothetical protein
MNTCYCILDYYKFSENIHLFTFSMICYAYLIRRSILKGTVK